MPSQDQIIGVLVQRALAKTDGLSVGHIHILEAYRDEHSCSTCGEIGWHKQNKLCGLNQEPPWDTTDKEDD